MPPLLAEPAAPPLRFDPDGSLRVGSSRVLFPVLINAYRDFGWSAEMLDQQYLTVTLPEVFANLAYYLDHQSDVDNYVDAWNQAGEESRTHWTIASEIRP